MCMSLLYSYKEATWCPEVRWPAKLRQSGICTERFCMWDSFPPAQVGWSNWRRWEKWHSTVKLCWEACTSCAHYVHNKLNHYTLIVGVGEGYTELSSHIFMCCCVLLCTSILQWPKLMFVWRVIAILHIGEFGDVCRGIWYKPNSKHLSVAIKTLKVW